MSTNFTTWAQFLCGLQVVYRLTKGDKDYLEP